MPKTMVTVALEEERGPVDVAGKEAEVLPLGEHEEDVRETYWLGGE
jgi:hypothetical protein